MELLNVNAKEPYKYIRYWYTELTDDIIKDILYINATRGKNRHYRIKTHGNKNGKGKTYYDITCGFDCETYTDTKLERAYMYIWQFCANGIVIKGRTYDELLELFKRIKAILQPKENNRLLVFIHNMSYEASFFLRWFNCENSKDNFFKEQRAPLKITHDSFIEFRDSMALVGGDSLSGLAKKYTNTQKCKGDLDYAKPRNRYTQLTELEEGYCDNDVLILSEFARYVFDSLIPKYKKLPMTQTGILSAECNELLKQFYGKNIDIWRANNIKRSPADFDTYTIQSNYLYRGGYTHACVDVVGEVLTDLLGVDITSSYPYVCTQKVFPRMFERVGDVPVSRVNEDIQKGLVSIFIARFTCIKSKGLHSIESKHKCLKLSSNTIIDNGRVYFSGEMTVYLTSFDWQNYQHFYEWESVEITRYEVSETRYLYKHIAVPMLQKYKEKAELKRAGKPYGIVKGFVNSFYGFCVKRLNGEMTVYDNNGFSTSDAKAYDEQIQNSITCCYDGIFISSVARWRLLTLAYDVYNKFGIASVYMDTDSHKFLHPTQELINYLEGLNRKIETENRKNIEFFTEYSPEYADLGTWDIEYYPFSMYDPASTKTYLKRAKTLGAKRYILEVDRYNKETNQREIVLNQTIAGLPKGEMMKQYGSIDECFERFSDNMVISGCKLYSKYIDEPYEITVTDEQGNTDTHLEMSCNALVPSNFSMTIDEIWRSWYIDYNSTQDTREKRIL